MSKKKNNNKKKDVDFPDDIVEEILLRLPLKPLVGFKCVSKGWNSTITHPNFCLKTQPQFALRCQQYHLAAVYDSGRKFGFYSVRDKSFSPIQSEIPIKSVFKYPYDTRNFYGSYNGLWVLGYSSDVFLFNPINKYFEKAFTVHDRETMPNIGHRDVRSTGGLCYDSSTDDYKLVLATEFQQSFTVYNLRAKTWLHAREDFDFGYEMCWSNNVVNLDERIYWLVTYGKGKDWWKSRTVKKIIFFDARADMLSEAPIPEPKPGEGFRGILGLGVLDGCLAMTSRSEFSLERANNIEVWVMKEHGAKDSWTMLYTLEFLPGLSCLHMPLPCWPWSNGMYAPVPDEGLRIVEPFFLTEEGLLILKVDDVMVAYNLKENSNFKIFPEEFEYSCWFIVPHLETLKSFEHKVQAGARAAAEGRSDWLEL